MSIVDSNIIDAISTNPEGDIVLSISDHLKWDEENQHLLVLQEKINSYLRFIEIGELNEVYPSAKGRNLIIHIYARFSPNKDGEIFLKRVKETIESAGYYYEFSLLG